MPNRYRNKYEVRATKNEDSLGRAEHHKEPWTEADIEILDLWDTSAPTADQDLTELAEILGRTREATRQMYHTVQRLKREGLQYTRTTRTVTTHVGPVTRTTTETSERRRPAWMDDEGLPDWYV